MIFGRETLKNCRMPSQHGWAYVFADRVADALRREATCGSRRDRRSAQFSRLHQKKRPLSRWRPVSCVSSGHFRVQVPFTSRIVGSLFPKEQVPASAPHPPREVGTTLTPIVAFPCGRTESARILRAVASSTLCSGERRGRHCDRDIALLRAIVGWS